MNDKNFLWEDIENYINQQEIFHEISVPGQAKGLTNAVGIF
jgi:hypothetical protein